MEPFIIVVTILVLILALGSWSEWRRRRELANRCIIVPGRPYPNNHHVFGVGYFHATSRAWYPLAWNEFHEDRGYYWDGSWHSEPDQRLIGEAIPDGSEIDRVNSAWRAGDPDAMKAFYDDVVRSGFGTALRRREGR
jgi:hypothetical protein